jgi:ABC-type glycerol-3-phosphate transport system substrate-binding protein
VPSHKQTKMSKLKIASLIMLVLLLSAGCGGRTTAKKEVVLTFWKTFEDSERIEPLIAAYEAKNPNVRIMYSKKNIDDYEDDLLNALAAGQGPDIFSIQNNWLPGYEDKIIAAPEKAFPIRAYKDAFVDVVANDFTKENKIYGVALAVDSLALYYNKDLLGTQGIATTPKTWDEFSEDVIALTRQDRTGYFTRSGVAMGLAANVNRSVDILYLLMLQAGSVPWSDDRLNPSFTGSIERDGARVAPGVEALEFYTSFADPSSPHYTWNARSDYSIDAFVNGRAAYLYSYAYTRDTIAQKAPNLNYGVANVPQYSLSDPAVNFANYWGEVVSNQSDNQAVAWDFLKFISSKDQLDAYYAKHKQPSSRRDLIELQIQDPEIGPFANANLTAKSFYKPDQERIDGIFEAVIENVLLNGLDSDEALSQAESQAAALVRNF